MEEVLKYNSFAKDVSSSESLTAVLLYFWYLKATCQNIKLCAWVRFRVANTFHIQDCRLLKAYCLPSRFNNIKVKTLLLSMREKVETKALERNNAGGGTEIPVPYSLISQEMLDRFTQRLRHDAGMFNGWSHCSLKASNRITRPLQCSIVLDISGDDVITSCPFWPGTTKLYNRHHIIQAKIISLLFS